MEGEQENWSKKKKDENDELPNSNTSQEQVEQVQVADGVAEKQGQASYHFSDLPPEILFQILNCVDTKSLFKCRLVNRRWNEISSPILCERPEPKVVFPFEQASGLFRRQRIQQQHLTRESKSLEEFLKCMENCGTCPYSRFSFSVGYSTAPAFFEHENWNQFLHRFRPDSNQNQQQNQEQNSYSKIKYLELNFSTGLAVFIPRHFARYFIIVSEKLRDLLLHKIPHLEELNLGFHELTEPPGVHLFPMTEKNQNQYKENSYPIQAQLVHLKVLYRGSNFYKFPGIFKHLLTAAVNLKRVYLGNGDDEKSPLVLSAQNFQLFHTAGKLHVIKEAEIKITDEFLSAARTIDDGLTMEQWKNHPQFKFKQLRLSIDINPVDSISCGRASHFLSLLFASNKDVLTKLKMSPLGFLKYLEWPQLGFKNLQHLNLLQNFANPNENQNEPLPFFSPRIGFKSLNIQIFSVVHTLKLEIQDWTSAFPQEDSLPNFPGVENLSLYVNELEENGIVQLALSCPNLKTLKICSNQDSRPPKMEFLHVGRAIWTHMRQLESLHVELDVDAPENNPHALDSCFTGISPKNCQRLHDLHQAAQLLDKWQVECKIPEEKLQVEREFPSVLDLEDLNHLGILPFSVVEIDDVDLFTKSVTWISFVYAFKHLNFEHDEEEESNDEDE